MCTHAVTTGGATRRNWVMSVCAVPVAWKEVTARGHASNQPEVRTTALTWLLREWWMTAAKHFKQINKCSWSMSSAVGNEIDKRLVLSRAHVPHVFTCGALMLECAPTHSHSLSNITPTATSHTAIKTRSSRYAPILRAHVLLDNRALAVWAQQTTSRLLVCYRPAMK